MNPWNADSAGHYPFLKEEREPVEVYSPYAAASPVPEESFQKESGKWMGDVKKEIDRRDIFYLCWSQNASRSPEVDKEWRYALKQKGIDGIEPIPLEPPELCPPPVELSEKHFNDKYLYFNRNIE